MKRPFTAAIPVRVLNGSATEQRQSNIENHVYQTDPMDDVLALQDYLLQAQESKTGVDADDFVQRCYAVVDAISKPARDNSVCQKGCAHCCKVPLTITALEAHHLNTQSTMVMLTKSTAVYTPTTEPCPMLNESTGTCSQYSRRPISCRTYFTIDDPALCHDPNQSHLIINHQSSPAVGHVIDMLRQVSRMAGLAEYADIRHFYPS